MYLYIVRKYVKVVEKSKHVQNSGSQEDCSNNTKKKFIKNETDVEHMSVVFFDHILYSHLVSIYT
jgi:hypothetical protein